VSITREQALQLAQTAFAEGEARGVVNISVVVTDPGGHVRVAMRADGQGIFGVETATAKAVTALGFNRSTVTMAAVFSPQATTGISGATGGRFAPLGGGVVITDSEGRIVGGAGLSGGLPDVDHEIIVKALETHGFKALN
jgi:uncharacterized protein GlcG (DUF336 family)